MKYHQKEIPIKEIFDLDGPVKNCPRGFELNPRLRHYASNDQKT